MGFGGRIPRKNTGENGGKSPHSNPQNSMGLGVQFLGITPGNSHSHPPKFLKIRGEKFPGKNPWKKGGNPNIPSSKIPWDLGEEFPGEKTLEKRGETPTFPTPFPLNPSGIPLFPSTFPPFFSMEFSSRERGGKEGMKEGKSIPKKPQKSQEKQKPHDFPSDSSVVFFPPPRPFFLGIFSFFHGIFSFFHGIFSFFGGDFCRSWLVFFGNCPFSRAGLT